MFGKTEKKAQVAVETLIVVGIIMLLLMPAMYLFFNFINTSSQQILDAQINDIGKAIIKNAEALYYYGRGSAITLNFEFSDQITDIIIEEHVNNLGELYYTLIFVVNIGAKERLFLSNIKIVAVPDSETLSEPPLEGKKVFRLTNIDGKTIGIERLV